MDCGLTRFSIEEITSLLAAEGIERGTLQFVNELGRRFRRSDLDDGTYVERDDWSRGTTSVFQAVLDGDLDPKCLTAKP